MSTRQTADGEIRRVTANGLEVAYLEEGRGPLVVLLHGFPDTARTWDNVRPRLAAAGFRAVSPWLRGYAPTEIPTRDPDARTLADDALALIAALGETRAIVVGHDWGATAAYGAASIAPERVAQLVVVAIPHPATLRVTPASLWRARHFLAYKLRGAPSRFAADDLAALPAIYKRWSPAWSPAPDELADIRATFADPACLHAAFGYYRALTFRPPPHLRVPIAVPTVAFAGRTDSVARPADFARAARMFTARYAIEELPGGHFMHREQPDEFAAKLLAHLEPHRPIRAS